MNFALSYLMTEEGLADRLGITVAEAEDLFAQFHAAYPALKAWSDRTVDQAKRNGFVMTRFGRKVPIWEFESASRNIRRSGERTAGNAPIQGSATGDYMKIAMARASQALAKAGLSSRVKLVMNVHDALEFYVRKDVRPGEVIRVLQPAVVFPVEGWPAMKAVWHLGERWGSVQELELLPGGGLRVVRKEGSEPAIASMGDEDELGEVDVTAVRSAAGGDHAPPDYEDGSVPVAPEVAADSEGRLLGPAAGVVYQPPGPAGGPPRTVIIEVPDMPATEQAHALMAMLLARDGGSNTAVLRTPDGDITIHGAYHLTPVDEPQVSIILGGAIVYYDLDSVDTDALARGLEL